MSYSAGDQLQDGFLNFINQKMSFVPYAGVRRTGNYSQDEVRRILERRAPGGVEKSVLMIHKKTGDFKIFGSYQKAAKHIGVSRHAIHAAIKRKTACKGWVIT